MDAQFLSGGLDDLKELSAVEYRQSLEEVCAEDVPELEKAQRIARLAGIRIKQPFALPVALQVPSQTRAYRAWRLDEEAFENSASKDLWQYKLLEHLAVKSSSSPLDIALYAESEIGFFGFVAQEAKRYICDERYNAEIKEALIKAGIPEAGTVVANPHVIVGAGGLALGSALVTHIPLLGMVGAPVLAGFVLVLYVVGKNGFCKWVNSASTDHGS